MEKHIQSYQYTPGSTFVVRIAGLPMERLRLLRFDQTTALIEEFLTRESELRLQAEALSNALHSVIGTIENKQIRGRLIAARRAIYQLQLPRPKELDDHVWAILSVDLAARIRSWIEQAKQWLAFRSQGENVLESEWAHKRQMLQDIAKTVHFQQGLVLGSKDLYVDVMRWLQSGAQETPRPDRRAELGLFTYLSRAATKTSPFSTFMSSGRGYWVNDGPTFSYSKRWRRLSTAELSWTIAHRIAYELASWPEIRHSLALRVNTSVLEEDSCLRLLGWKRGEVVLKLAKSPTLQHLMERIRDTEAASYEAIITACTQEQGQEPEMKQFLDQLIKIGLLELDFGIPDQSPDYLGQLLTYLQQFRNQHIVEICGLLQKVHSCLQRYPITELPAERLEIRDTIHTTLESVYQRLALPQRGFEVPTKNAFYENSLLEGVDVRCSLTGCSEVLNNLNLLQQLLALYDVFLPTRLVVAAFFVDHYGRGARVSLLRFYEDFCRELRQPEGGNSTSRVSGSHLKELFEKPFFPFSVNLREIDQVVQLRTDFYRQLMEQPIDSSQVCQLDPALLQQFITSFPPFVIPLSSFAIYAQMLIRDKVPYLVVNEIGAGFGRGEGRLLFLENQLNKTAARLSSQIDQEKDAPLPVEIAGVFGSNANLHTPQTPYEITYPGTVSTRPQEEQIHLNDLDVIHDPDNNRLCLVSRRLQRELLPTPFGFLADFLRPPMYRFLYHLFGQGPVNPFSHLQVKQGKNSITSLPIRFCPRICLGRLIIARATWVVRVECLPQRDKGSSAFEYMLNVQRWIASNRLPQECFIRILADLVHSSERKNANLTLLKDRKPLYIDFRNYLSIMMFEQIVHHTENMSHTEDRVVYFQEALPHQEDLIFSDGEGSYVSEFLLELSHTGQSR